MKVWLKMLGKKFVARVPEHGAMAVEVNAPCPACGTCPMFVKGTTGPRIKNNDTYVSDAVCTKCGDEVGELYAQVDTLFGIEEDERIRNGRWRIY